MPSILLYALGIALVVNFIFFVIAYTYQTDKLTDMTYSLTFILIAALGLWLSEWSITHIIAAGLVILWALRLGSFLMRRVHKLGRDDRFDDLRPYALKFLGFWTMQALTCFIVSLSTILILGDPNTALTPLFVVGLAVALFGLVMESIADEQKYRFKNMNPDKFMNTGLWSRIRHPNYTGEILFWLGLSIMAIPSPFGIFAFLSPIWISFILIKFSGIPLLKAKWDKRYGKDHAFINYKKQSWYLFPFLY